MPLTRSPAAQTRIAIDQSILDKIDEIRPQYMDRTTFINFQLDSSITLGKPNDKEREVLPSLNKEEEVKNQKLLSESINHPPKQRKQIDPELLEFEILIREFWSIKGGGKSDTAWKLLMSGLKAIKGLDGSDAAEDQIVAAINGKWKGITLRNYQQFKAKSQPKPWQQEPSSKHPAHQVFVAEAF